MDGNTNQRNRNAYQQVHRDQQKDGDNSDLNSLADSGQDGFRDPIQQ